MRTGGSASLSDKAVPLMVRIGPASALADVGELALKRSTVWDIHFGQSQFSKRRAMIDIKCREPFILLLHK